MDDAPEKVRRNLMAVSTAIILLWFLQAPLQGKVFWIVDLSNVESWRPWSAALAVLVYFALRFHNEPTTVKARQSELKDFRFHWLISTEDHLAKHLAKNLREGVAPNKIKGLHIPLPPLADILNFNVNTRHGYMGDPVPPNSCWLQINLKDSKSKESIYQLSLTPADNTFIFISTLKSGKWFKWASLEFGLPYLLALIAAMLCCWSIYSHPAKPKSSPAVSETKIVEPARVLPPVQARRITT